MVWLPSAVIRKMPRPVKGISIGGEWSGSVLLAMECGDQDKRGLLGSFAQVGCRSGW
jgi:hypothetical protein